MTNLSKKIVFTGGHHNSALAVALELKEQGFKIFWLGHKYSMWGDRSPSAEYREVIATGIPFYELRAGKFYRTYHPLKLMRIPRGFIEASRYLREIKPDLIVSFGGYLAVPVVVVGWFMGIPSITHEQTAASGLSNQLIGWFAKKIFLTYHSSKPFFPSGKTEVIGLPLPDDFFRHLREVRRRGGGETRTIFITCGKQGAHVINKAVMPVIKELVRKYRIIHQTGSSTVYCDFAAALEARKRLDVSGQRRYEVVDYLQGESNWKTWFAADLVVGRAGAHTVYQLGVTGKPCLLIPIPWVVNNEQFRNAEILRKNGSAEVLEEKDLTAEALLNRIQLMTRQWNSYGQNALIHQRDFPVDAKGRMVEEIKQFVR